MCAQVSWFTRSSRLPRHASPVSTAKVETVHPLCNCVLSVLNACDKREIPEIVERAWRLLGEVEMERVQLREIELALKDCVEPHIAPCSLKELSVFEFCFTAHS